MMGYVDAFDRQVLLYHYSHRTSDWKIGVFLWLFEAMCENARIAWKEMRSEEEPRKQFLIALARELSPEVKYAELGLRELNSMDFIKEKLELQEGEHQITKLSDQNKRCDWCKKSEGMCSSASLICQTCGLAFHLKCKSRHDDLICLLALENLTKKE